MKLKAQASVEVIEWSIKLEQLCWSRHFAGIFVIFNFIMCHKGVMGTRVSFGMQHVKGMSALLIDYYVTWKCIYIQLICIYIFIAHVLNMLFLEAFGLLCIASLLFWSGQFWECLSGLLPLITLCLAQMVSTEGLQGLLITQSPSSVGVQEFGRA